MDGETETYEKSVSELQTEIIINESDIEGTLNEVTDYSGFSGLEEEQSGHYLALKVEAPEGATIITELINGTHGPVDMSSDKWCVYRIKDQFNQKISIAVTVVDKVPVTKTTVYDLSKLVLA